MAIRRYDLLVEMLREYVEGWKPCVVPGYIERRRLVAKTIRWEEVDVVRPRWTSRGEGGGRRRKRSGNRCAVSGLSDETSKAGYDDDLGTGVGSLARSVSGEAMDSQIASASHEETSMLSLELGIPRHHHFLYLSPRILPLSKTKSSLTRGHRIQIQLPRHNQRSPKFKIPATNLTERETGETSRISLEPRLSHDSPPAAIGTFLRSHGTNHVNRPLPNGSRVDPPRQRPLLAHQFPLDVLTSLSSTQSQ
jgi:hypothetical protein